MNKNCYLEKYESLKNIEKPYFAPLNKEFDKKVYITENEWKDIQNCRKELIQTIKERDNLHRDLCEMQEMMNGFAQNDFEAPTIVYFISGHRDVTQEEFDRTYAISINNAILKGHCRFVVGDYEGVDIMAQNYLVAKGVGNKTTVYHMFDKPRHFNTEIKHTWGGFKTDEERDSAMTEISDVDIAFVRKGKWSSGTAQNIKRRHRL